MKFPHISFTLTLLIIFSISVFSQNKSVKKLDKAVEVKANVIVWDSKMMLIDDVNQEDIKIFEDGVEQKITSFVKKEPILNLGFVIDNSGSMRDNLKQVTQLAMIITNNLRPDDQAFLVRFIDSDKIEVTQDWTSNQADLQVALENMFIDSGQSSVIDAIYLSAQKLLERERQYKSRRYAILLISDGEDRDSFYKYKDMIKLFNGSDLQVFMISYANNAPYMPKSSKNLSLQIAMDTGGTTYVLDKNTKNTNFELILKAIIAELRSPFIIGYTSSNQNKDNLPRNLSVQITNDSKGEKRVGYIRESYLLPKN